MTSTFGLVVIMVVSVLVCGTVVALAGIIYKGSKDARERALWHEERMAMIEAGIHPDYPPGEAPTEKPNDALWQTADYGEN